MLGSFRVSVGGRPVGLTGPKRQALLAMLALEPGRVISVDRLIDGLWGDRPPSTARAQVQSLVHAVRATLEGVVETASPGYTARITPGHTDVGRFADLIDQARSIADPVRAVALFRSAEGLWRGPALDGIVAPFAPVEAARLREQCLSAVEERVALELDLGRHRAVVPELSTVVAANPCGNGCAAS